MPAADPHARVPQPGLPLLHPLDDAARLIAVMAREHQPLTLAELAPRAGIPIADARRAIERLRELKLLEGSPDDGWKLHRAAVGTAPAVETSARALDCLRARPNEWIVTPDIERAVAAGYSTTLYALHRLTQLGEVERCPHQPRGYEWRAVVPDREP